MAFENIHILFVNKSSIIIIDSFKCNVRALNKMFNIVIIPCLSLAYPICSYFRRSEIISKSFSMIFGWSRRIFFESILILNVFSQISLEKYFFLILNKNKKFSYLTTRLIYKKLWGFINKSTEAASFSTDMSN